MADPHHDPDWTPPRAPSTAEWEAMSAEERQRAVEALPAWMTEAELTPPEGDDHYLAKEGARDALSGWFRGRRRGFYVGAETIVYYPGERRFSPDVCVVLDVEPGRRERWVVSAEGKGLDFALEILVSGDRRKDLRDNVELYAGLGIPEYFVYEVRTQRIHGFRLPPGGGAYRPILAQAGRYASEVLAIDLALEDGRLRFYAGNAAIFETPELLERLSKTTTQLEARLIEANTERDELAKERDVAAEARDEIAKERDVAAEERDEIAKERDELRAQLEAALARLKG